VSTRGAPARTLGWSIYSAAGAARTLGGQTLDRHATDTTYQPDNRTAAKVTVPSCKLGIPGFALRASRGKNSTQNIMVVLCYTEGDHNKVQICRTPESVSPTDFSVFWKGRRSEWQKRKDNEQERVIGRLARAISDTFCSSAFDKLCIGLNATIENLAEINHVECSLVSPPHSQQPSKFPLTAKSTRHCSYCCCIAAVTCIFVRSRIACIEEGYCSKPRNSRSEFTR